MTSRQLLSITSCPRAGRTSIAAILPVEIERLDLEEFAIACLQPSLNRMRRLARTAIDYGDARAAVAVRDPAQDVIWMPRVSSGR